ncbi:Glycogen-binding subunit 76A-like Protein [Tribolium castaneum]|uniref:Glycogen-binding subunit 76A-like Protein n=1 Tax=Tribolium castaneum TaxID=7070 RepID=D6WHH0_TRICA|nr:PREDICTED: glycogen-binding subunit 76A [Tribolium castaneum]EFA00664.2 Glycogen-binding subunit 76A-like Protein [Tribolium castaneum]|eukprot:XP_975371.1 PREDICTED: glycogen-binding subunit 76A [Tribolium castaneum]
MTTGPEKCGLSSLLPMSCRERAEAFARHLHSRLTSLESEDGHDKSENSWLTARENSLTVSQPKSIENNLYLDIESPQSPTEELDRTEIEKIINKENLYYNSNWQCPTFKENSLADNTQTDNDSDGSFYDSVTDLNPPNESEQTLNDEANELVNGREGGSSSSNVQEETLDCQALDNELDKVIDINWSPSPKSRETEPVAVRNELYKENFAKIPLLVTPTESNQSALNDQNDDDLETEEKTPRVRRCSSLKTGKTPPGTPYRKKIVRFADVLGLDLADIRTFLDEIPKIPTSAYNDLQDVDLKLAPLPLSFCPTVVDKILIPLFQQPGILPDFIDRLRENQVCLDSVVVQDPISLSISGIVRVKNLDFHKSVHIRYTLDSWQSFADVPAVYVENSCDGFSDKFSFLFYAHNLTVGQTLEFAVRFQCKGCQYWDNNYGKNYCFQCLPATNAPTGTGTEDWSTDFY